MSTAAAPETPSFYADRHLDAPAQQWRPQDRDAFCQCLDRLDAQQRPWTLVGAGQHHPGPLANRQVIHTEGLATVADVDDKSGTVVVGAGTRWKDLQAAVARQGWSLAGYDLHPATATVGGLLARRLAGPPMLGDGSLLDGCIGLSVHRPNAPDYRYLTAPKKAAGPDLRHLFVGQQGGFLSAHGVEGAILEATFCVYRPRARRLLRFENCPVERAVEILCGLSEAAIQPAWTHYRMSAQTLQIALCAPGQLLRRRRQWIAAQFGAPDAIGDDDATDSRRHWLEARHPDRRTHPAARQCRVFAVVPRALARHGATALFGDAIDDVEIIAWTTRRALAFVRYAQPIAAGDADPDTTPETPPGSCWAHWPLIAPTR